MSRQKFQLGDRVRYESKRPAIAFSGTVIGTEYGEWNRRTYYLVEPDDPQESNAILSFQKSYIPAGQPHIADKFVTDVWNSKYSKNDSCWISGASRNLTHGMYDYSPSQEGDKADDI